VDEVLGSCGVAWVVPAEAAHPPDLGTLRRWCRELLADYKAPDRLVVVEFLPRNHMGKVDKAALKAALNV
jgi:non-ribosomal peptide synthetase component E (peptide arylation enzyme)